MGSAGTVDRSKLIGVLVKLGLLENVELVGEGIVNVLPDRRQVPEFPLPEKIVRSTMSPEWMMGDDVDDDVRLLLLLLSLLLLLRITASMCAIVGDPAMAKSSVFGSSFTFAAASISESLVESNPFLAMALRALFSCVLRCLAKWSLRMKRLLHTEQVKRFSPVCVRKCRCNSSERVKRFRQCGQPQTNGLSPVCHRKCAFKWLVLPYTLLQDFMWHM